MKEYVLFICGGKWQLPWFMFLKSKGHQIILVDPYTYSPCVKEAEIHIVCDARDTETILNEVNKLGYPISFVTSDQTDVSTMTVAILSEKLGCFGNSSDVVKLFSNKVENRKFLADHYKNHYPAFCKAFTADDVALFYHGSGADIMIKPADAQSSRGVFHIDTSNFHLLNNYFAEAKAHSNQGYIIAEKFLKGKEITVEGLCSANTHVTLAISDKKHFRTGIASELRYPAVLNNNLLQELEAFHNGFIKNTGLNFGITHSEYIVNADETDFWLVESACRGGGSLIPSHIVPWVSGLNVYETFYALSLGRIVPVSDRILSRNAILYFFEFKTGFVKKIKGFQEAAVLDGVVDIFFEFKEGDTIKAANDDRSRQGYVIVFGKTDTELRLRLDDVIKMIEVTIV